MVKNWHNKPYTVKICNKLPNIAYNQVVDLIKYANISLETYIYYMNKKININVDITITQWQNNSCTGGIYIYNFPKKKNQGVEFVKFTNLPHKNRYNYIS